MSGRPPPTKGYAVRLLKPNGTCMCRVDYPDWTKAQHKTARQKLAEIKRIYRGVIVTPAIAAPPLNETFVRFRLPDDEVALLLHLAEQLGDVP